MKTNKNNTIHDSTVKRKDYFNTTIEQNKTKVRYLLLVFSLQQLVLLAKLTHIKYSQLLHYINRSTITL